MEVVFVSGLPCSGKSVLTKRLVEYLGHDRAVRLPMDHYYLDAVRPEHFDPHHMASYGRDRYDWELLFYHIELLRSGKAIDTPRYDWENLRRVPAESGIGRSRHVEPRSVVFVDSFQPSLDSGYQHVFVNPSWELRLELIQVRSQQMPLPQGYESILRRLEQSHYRDSLEWLSENCCARVEHVLEPNLEALCCKFGAMWPQ